MASSRPSGALASVRAVMMKWSVAERFASTASGGGGEASANAGWQRVAEGGGGAPLVTLFVIALLPLPPRAVRVLQHELGRVRAERMAEGKGGHVYVVSMDWRHYFHQLKCGWHMFACLFVLF